MTKAAFLRAILETENAFVHLDPRDTNVVVPKHLKTVFNLVLLFGYNTIVPIVDLCIDDEDGISGTLSFSRTPFSVSVPWSRVFAIVGERTTRFMTWPEAFSKELLEEMQREQQRTAAKPAPPVLQPSTRPRGKRPNPAGLRLVENKK